MTAAMNKPVSFDIRQKVIAACTSSGWTAPHVAYVYEADATELTAELEPLLRDKTAGGELTLNAVLMRLVVEGIKAAPRANARVLFSKRTASGSIEIIDKIDINTPILLPDKRTITVKLPDCGNKSPAEIAGRLKQLKDKLINTNIDIALLRVGLEDTVGMLKRGNVFHAAGRIWGLRFGKNRLKRVSKDERDAYERVPKESRLRSADLNMGTVTVSNPGSAVRGTNGFPAIIDLVSPQAVAVGIGSLQERPMVCDSRVIPRKMIPFCIVFDHRALDFVDIAPMIRAMEAVFKNPGTIHTW
jgi:pyruvate dehydrogenase E2 component (dihydrolipoamide acetyltransferase)